MGRILSGRNRAMDVADPGSGGAAGKHRRSHVKRDVELVADDLITILRMSPSDKLKEHVRKHVARVVEYDGKHVGEGAVCGGAEAAKGSGSPADVNGGATSGIGAANSADDGEFHDDLEDQMWGD